MTPMDRLTSVETWARRTFILTSLSSVLLAGILFQLCYGFVVNERYRNELSARQVAREAKLDAEAAKMEQARIQNDKEYAVESALLREKMPKRPD